MKKTIIINIGNTIVHIEEDAYEVLTAYVNEIKNHFGRTADDFEIVTDIENRIAEMFAELLAAAQRQVIEMADVEQVIARMGRVEDFRAEDEDAPQESVFSAYAGQKKLYRDTDEGMIAGVCAGLGHYLNIEARWLRLIALLTIFLGGFGILAYLILWIATPRAVTRSEKMEMKGEATNLFGYKRSFEEELAAFKERMTSSASFGRRSGDFVSEFFSFLGKLLGSTGRLIGKILAGAFIVCGFGLMVCLLTAAAFLIFWDYDSFDYFPMSVINDSFREELIFAAFIVLFIPILALVLSGLRVAFHKRAISRNLSFALLLIWLCGLSFSVYCIARISSEFQEHAELVESAPLKAYPAYVVDVDQRMSLSHADSVRYHITDRGAGNRVIVNSDGYDSHPFRAPSRVRIDIEKSEDGRSSVTKTFESQGKSFRVALENAQNIDYRFSQRDSVLSFSPEFELRREANWRNQEVRVTLKVPVGTRLLLNDNLYRYLHFYYYSCDDDSRQDHREWIMTEDGLKCLSELRGKQPGKIR